MRQYDFFFNHREKFILSFFLIIGRETAPPDSENAGEACQGEWGSNGSAHDSVTIGADYPRHDALHHGNHKQTLQSAESRGDGG